MVDTLSTEIDPKKEASPRADPRRWLMLPVVLLVAFMGTLDTFIVNVAVPSIETHFHASFAEIQLVIAGYTLTFGVVLATGGRLGDLYGRKRFFLFGVAGFTLFSTLCGLAPSVTWLIIFRVFQGAMAALMLPQVISLLTISFLPEERGRAFSSYVTAMGLAAITGQVIGGLLIAANVLDLGWRSIFLINLPIGIVTLVAGWLLVHESRVPSARRLDLGGVALLSIALFLLIYPLAEGSSLGWSFWSFLSLALALLLLTVFVFYERWLTQHGGAPVVPLALFQSRSFVAGVLSNFLVQILFAAILLLLPFYLQKGLNYSPLQSGLVVMVMGLAFMLSSSISSKVVEWLNWRALHLGAALVTLGYLLTLLAVLIFVPLYGIAPLLVGLFITSSGNGTLTAPLINRALQGIDSSMAGAASGVYSTIHQVASALGVAVIGTIFVAILAHHAGLSSAFVVSLLVIVLVSVGLSFTVSLFPRNKETSRQ
jgi:EmrB/QacA subfamily drug resistance transporter